MALHSGYEPEIVREDVTAACGISTWKIARDLYKEKERRM